MTIEFWSSKKSKTVSGSLFYKQLALEMYSANVATLSLADQLVGIGYTKTQVKDWSNKKKRKLLFMHQNGHKCQYCTKPLELKDATWDHVVPLGKGGLDVAENKVVACEPCNHEKADMSLQEFFLTEFFIKRRFLWSSISG